MIHASVKGCIRGRCHFWRKYAIISTKKGPVAFSDSFSENSCRLSTGTITVYYNETEKYVKNQYGGKKRMIYNINNLLSIICYSKNDEKGEKLRKMIANDLGETFWV